MSQTTPLHIYPTHALTVMSSLLPSVTQHSKSQQLVRLTQTHSRFALLLQSLAHSSSKPPLPEPEPEVFSPSLTLAETSPSAWRAHVSHLHPRPLSLADSSGGTASFRELNFPAPLSCSTPSSPRRSLDVLPDAADGHGRRSVSAHQKVASTGPRPDVKAHAAHPGGRHKPSDSSASSASSGATHLSGGSKRQSSHTPQSSGTLHCFLFRQRLMMIFTSQLLQRQGPSRRSSVVYLYWVVRLPMPHLLLLQSRKP